MRRIKFLVFAFNEPHGGHQDLIGRFYSKKKAYRYLEKIKKNYMEVQLLDISKSKEWQE